MTPTLNNPGLICMIGARGATVKCQNFFMGGAGYPPRGGGKGT